MLLYATLCYSTLRYATLRYATLRYSTLRYATLRYATLRYSTLLYATLKKSVNELSTFLGEWSLDDTYVIDTAADSDKTWIWKSGPKLNEKRGSATCGVIRDDQGQLLVIAAFGSSEILLNSMEIMDFESQNQQWILGNCLKIIFFMKNSSIRKAGNSSSFFYK
jgi:hypothetical protein